MAFPPLVVPIVALGLLAQGPPADSLPDWRAEWETEDGFRLDLDSDGYIFPTAIAFVPDPGVEPDAPLYYVTELGGTIKVVTRDRSVHVFVDDVFVRAPDRELPAEQGETGLAGICLAPAQGYVFVTYAYRDSLGTFHNAIERFETRPGRFAVAPSDRRRLVPLLAGYRSAASHQIGPCQVDAGLLYVSVGDGMQPYLSGDPSAPLGKVLRMTLDGSPAPGNPFGPAADSGDARALVWAMGFRNPFSLRVVNGRVFVADNGPSVDRFLEAARGGAYLWDGTDWSMAGNAITTFSPSPSPVQMDFVPETYPGVPERYRGRFLIAMSGRPGARGPGDRRGAKGVVMVDFDFRTNRLRAVPRSILRFRGSGYQNPVGLALGPDGIYVVLLMPGPDGTSGIIRMSYAPDRAHPFLVSAPRSTFDLILDRGCLGCHALGDRRTGGVGPPLDQEELRTRLLGRLTSPGYEQAVAGLADRTDEPFRSYQEAREAVLAAEGMERVRLWVRYRIEQPRFDDPNAQMPDLRVPAGEAQRMADYLLGMGGEGAPAGTAGLVEALRRRLPRPRYEFVAFAFGVGASLGAIAGFILFRFTARRSQG